MKVDIGSGLQAYETPGYIHVDKFSASNIDMVWDLENGLPPEFDYDSLDEVRAHHVLEHINNLIKLFDSVWDALKPDGVFHIYVPNAHHIKAAWSDPTHVRCFTPETFDYFTRNSLNAYPYTNREWVIIYRNVNGEVGDQWEIEVKMKPVK